MTEFTGLDFPHLDLGSAVRRLLAPPGLTTPVPWRLVNTYSISLLGVERGYATVLRGPGVNLADGRPVVWVLDWLGRRDGALTRPAHVRGPAFFARVLDEGRARGIRHYLLGGSPETLAALQAAVGERFPGARIVGTQSPPFRPLTATEREEQDARIRDSGADLVWVGLGTPRQDMEAARLASAVQRPVIGVGAAFDFLAGTRAEAPVWVQRLALEWLFRLLSEPGRLWRRYTVGLIRFAAVAARAMVRPRPLTHTDTAQSAGSAGLALPPRRAAA